MQGIGKQFYKQLLFMAMTMVSLFMTKNVLASNLGVNNEYQSREYRAEIKEEFASPANWLPGVSTDSNIYIVNEGTAPIYVEARINLKWFGQDEITREEYALTFTVATTGAEEYAALISWGQEVVLLSKGTASTASLKLGLPTVETIEEAQGKWVLLDEVPDKEGNLNFQYVGLVEAGNETPLLVDYVQMNPKIKAKTMETHTIYNKESNRWETQDKINPSHSYENARFLLTVEAWTAQKTDNKVAEPTPSPVSTKLEDNLKQISQPKTGDEAGFIKYIILMLIVALVIAGHIYSLKMRQSEGGKMRKKSRKLRKLLITILCFASILGQVDVVRAEDKVIAVEYDIQYLAEAPTLTNEGVVGNTEKYLVLGKEYGVAATVAAPFGEVLEFPYIHAIPMSSHNDMRPSEYILDQLTMEFNYRIWDLEEYPKLQLPMKENYVLHVGDTIGLPEKAFWGIRKLSDNPYDEKFAIEHTFGYITKGGEWVWAVTKRGNWDPDLHEGTEYWQKSESDSNNRICWKRIIAAEVENFSPLVDGVAPYPARTINANNTGTIEDILVNREGELGSNYDLVSDLRVFGAVTRELLMLSNATILPDKHFSIEHDTAGISHLIEEGVYTAIGIGTVKSKVTDYEDDATIFTQEVIVSTSEKPDINIYRAGTDILYKNEWMSNDQSADMWRQKGLDIQAESRINGNYDLLTRIAGIEKKRTNVDKDSSVESVTNEKVLSWKNDNVDTDEVGVPATSIAYLAKSEERAISAESNAKYMRFDSVLPTISEVFFADDSWKKVTGHDAKDDLSKLNDESGGVHYLFVKREEAEPSEEIERPKDGKDWKSLKNYKLPTEVGEYDLYVYAKDNATNRSEALRLNNGPIVIKEKVPTKVRLKKEVSDNAGNDSDIFVIHLEEKETILGSVALRRNETSGWMSLDMSEEEFRTIKVTEVVPMDYTKGYRIYVTDGDGNTTLLDEEEDKVTLKAGDEITITIENEFEHAGYFRGKDAVKNVFQRFH